MEIGAAEGLDQSRSHQSRARSNAVVFAGGRGSDGTLHREKRERHEKEDKSTTKSTKEHEGRQGKVNH